MSEEEVPLSTAASRASEDQKPKKKTFVEPSLEGELAEDATKAKEYLDERLANEDDRSNYMDKAGVFIPDDRNIEFVTSELGEKYLKYFKTYKSNQIKLDPDLMSASRLGIVSGPARFKGSNQQKVCVDAVLSSDMLKLDNEVTNAVSDLLPEGAVPIPAVLLTNEESTVGGGARVWRYLHGTSSCKIVAIVPLTNCIIAFVPHSKNMQDKWDEMTFGGTATKETHPKHHILPLSFRKKIDQLDRVEDEEEGIEGRDIIYEVALQPGSIFLTHRGMPISIRGMPDEDDDDEDADALPFMVKTVAFEVPTKGSKRRNLTEQAIETGYFTAGQLHENMYYKTLPILKDGPPDPHDENIFCMPRATKEEAPWLFDRRKKTATTKIPKKVGGGTPKKIAPKRDRSPPPSKKDEEDEEKGEQEDSSSSGGGGGEGGEEKAPPVEAKKKKQKQVASSSTSPTTKSKKKGEDANKERLNVAKAKHQTLKDAIEKLDPRAWKTSHSENAEEKERAADKALEEGTLKANVLRKYEDALNTLDSKVKDAQKGEEVLPRIDQMLVDMERILDEIDGILLPSFKLEKNSSERRRKALGVYKSMQEELYKHEKKIAEQLESCRDLQTKAQEKVAKKNAPGGEAVGGGSEEVPDLPDLPSVDEDALSPYIVVGKEKIKKYMRAADSKKTILADAAKAHDNNHARELLKGYTNAHIEVVNQLPVLFRTEDPETMQIDLSKHLAYSTALEACIELLNTHKEAVKTASKKRPREKTGSSTSKITCPECEAEDVVNFADSGHCAVCFAELIVQARHNKIDDRVCLLETQAGREEKDLEGLEGPLQQQWKNVDGRMYENYTTAADNFFEKPNKRTWDIFSKLMDEMDKILPEGDDMDVDDDENEYGSEEESDSDDDDDDDDEQEEGDSTSNKKKKKRRKGAHEGILSLRNLPSDEEEASFSDSSDEREYGTKSSRKRDRPSSSARAGEENALGDRALKTMKAIRVLPVWEKILDRYSDPKKHALLDAYLDELHTDTKYTYSVKVKSVREEEEDLPPSAYHTHFLDQAKAMEIKQNLTVPGETRAIVSKHEVKF